MDGVLDEALAAAEGKAEVLWLNGADAFCEAADRGELQHGRILFAAELEESGINLELAEVCRYLHTHRDALEGSVGGILVDGVTDLYTKDAGRRTAFAASLAGCTFPGKSLVEGTGSLKNYLVLSKNYHTTPRGAYGKSAGSMV